ncbi:MAG: hypothetical protein NVSMB27_15960 [Ktedonobacteraceae bacterium]
MPATTISSPRDFPKQFVELQFRPQRRIVHEYSSGCASRIRGMFKAASAMQKLQFCSQRRIVQ